MKAKLTFPWAMLLHLVKFELKFCIFATLSARISSKSPFQFQSEFNLSKRAPAAAPTLFRKDGLISTLHNLRKKEEQLREEQRLLLRTMQNNSSNPGSSGMMVSHGFDRPFRGQLTKSVWMFYSIW